MEIAASGLTAPTVVRFDPQPAVAPSASGPLLRRHGAVQIDVQALAGGLLRQHCRKHQLLVYDSEDWGVQHWQEGIALAHEQQEQVHEIYQLQSVITLPDSQTNADERTLIIAGPDVRSCLARGARAGADADPSHSSSQPRLTTNASESREHHERQRVAECLLLFNECS